MPEALNINDRFLQGLANGLAPCYADDRIIGHHTWNYLLTWRDYIPTRPAIKPRPTGRFCLQEGGILIDRREQTELYLALNKGGVFKLFYENKFIASDTQFSLQIKEGNKVKNAVGHLVGNYKSSFIENEIIIEGSLGWAKQKQMNPLNLIVLRLVMLSFGRFFPDLIRKLLQKVLITGKKSTSFYFERQFQWQDGYWQVIDKLSAPTWHKVTAVGIGGDQTSIYVVMSRTFQAGQLQPWLDLTNKIKQLSPGQILEITRKFNRKMS